VDTALSEGLDAIGADLLAIQQLTALACRIRLITSNAEVLILGRHPAVMGKRVDPQSWSVAECLDHLTQTTRSFLPGISLAIAEAGKLTKNRRLRTGFLPSLLVRSLTPPYRIRLKVLPQLTPENLDSQTAWSNFVNSQYQLLEILGSAAGLAIDEVKIKSPVYARFSYNIFGAFRILVAHQSRHVWQIEQTLKLLDSRAVGES